MLLTPQEWKEWRSNSVTQEWFKYLNTLREKLKEEWASSTYTGEFESETLQRNAAAIGQADLLKVLQETEYEDIEEIKSE